MAARDGATTPGRLSHTLQLLAGRRFFWCVGPVALTLFLAASSPQVKKDGTEVWRLPGARAQSRPTTLDTDQRKITCRPLRPCRLTSHTDLHLPALLLPTPQATRSTRLWASAPSTPRPRRFLRYSTSPSSFSPASSPASTRCSSRRGICGVWARKHRAEGCGGCIVYASASNCLRDRCVFADGVTGACADVTLTFRTTPAQHSHRASPRSRRRRTSPSATPSSSCRTSSGPVRARPADESAAKPVTNRHRSAWPLRSAALRAAPASCPPPRSRRAMQITHNTAPRSISPLSPCSMLDSLSLALHRRRAARPQPRPRLDPDRLPPGEGEPPRVRQVLRGPAGAPRRPVVRMLCALLSAVAQKSCWWLSCFRLQRARGLLRQHTDTAAQRK